MDVLKSQLDFQALRESVYVLFGKSVLCAVVECSEREIGHKLAVLIILRLRTV